MKYFFILGNNPTLSLAELSAVFKFEETNNIILLNNVLLADIAEDLDAVNLINRLGGTIKIGVFDFETINSKDAIVREAMKIIEAREIEGKFYFGISAYSRKPMNIRPIGMEVKNNLRSKNINCRFVVSREAALSSVVVEQNKLLKNGVELVLINDKGKIYGGHTLAVQPFKELSFRDYGRPARDDRSGMLPPKLAQIMINLSGINPTQPSPSQGEGKAASPSPCEGEGWGGVLLDPFCGSGTILTEAALMGFQNLTGADISPKAIADTRKNMEWNQKNFKFEILNFKLLNSNAENLSVQIKSNSIDAIITEPYLGPQRGKIDFINVKKELEKLYSDSLVEFYKILKPSGRLVMVFPAFQSPNSQFQIPNFKNLINININGFKIINLIPETLLDNKNIKLTDRNTIVYGREGQRVWREIVVMKKSSS